MRPRGWLAVAAGVLGVALLVPLAPAQGTTRDSVLTLSIPGPFRGCGYFATSTNESLRAVLDLVRPSAFLTSQYGVLQGAAGPIASAELLSLDPQTVVYTVTPGWTWSNGRAFTVADLQSWATAARTQATSLADGYRDIASLTVSPTGDQLTAVFTAPFADWNTLFRDVNERGVSLTCTLGQLASQPSLGPYLLSSVTPTLAVLHRNPTWLGTRARFATVRIFTTLTATTLPATPVVDYEYSPSIEEMSALGSDAALDGHVGSSDQLVVVGFSSRRATTKTLAVREFLSFAIDRQAVIDAIAGPVSYNPGLADSVLYPQGQMPYPGTLGLGPSAQTGIVPLTTLPTATNLDCVACAAPLLAAAGYREINGRWRAPDGRALTVSLAVGPSGVDRAAARLITATWRRDGVTVTTFSVGNNVGVARALHAGRADAGLFTVTTAVEPFQTARAWTGTDEGSSYDLGWRAPMVDQWFASAQDTYNPVDAEADYADIDQFVSAQAWERPLFTEPSVLMWSSDLAAVYASTSLTGLVDQVPTWGLSPRG